MNQRPRTEAELIELVRSSDERASDALHRRIESMIDERSFQRARRSILGGSRRAAGAGLGRRLASAGALVAVVIAVLAVVLSGGGGHALSLRQATALTLSSATAPAPKESARNRTELVAAVQGVHFPYWEEHFGWRSTGQRTDSVAGRTVMTVFYANGSGQQIGYAIVSGTPAPRVDGGTENRRNGTSYWLRSTQGAQVVTWLRNGRLCVLSGRGVAAGTLLRLASWVERGSAA
ncbi:MAG TPA: hypothetical protein VNZ01_01650 [Solirubrobacteraceae bacterium]|jgi:hypothetical protein|nr:hypothetical protein [Solirubrobacteraceae bacterium]